MIAHLLASSSNGGGTLILLAAGPAGGGGLYWVLWRFYRNTDKSHSFESETRVVAQAPTGNDRKVNEVKGTKKTAIDGDNHLSHRQRVQRVQ